MTVRELIETLEQYNGDLEVRLATQPNYPLQSTICNVASLHEVQDYPEEDDFVDVVYITEGGQCHDNPYAPRGLWS